MHRVVRYYALYLIVIVAPSIHVSIETREVAARNFNPNTVAGGEIVASGHRLWNHFVDLAWFHPNGRLLVSFAIPKTLDGFVQVVGGAIRQDIDDLDRYIRILNV
jgi:hypothetical protein